MEDLNFDISFADVLNNTFSFTSLSSFKDFAKQEAKFWKERPEVVLGSLGGSRPRTLSSAAGSSAIFLRVVALLEEFMSTEDISPNQLVTFRRNILNEVSSLASNSWINSNDPYAEMWLGSYSLSSAAGETFYSAIVKGQVGSISFETIKGQNLAYEAAMQDESLISQRRQAEVKTFKVVRARLLAKTDELISDTDNYRNEFKEWITEARKEASDLNAENQRALEVDQASFVDAHNSTLRDCTERLGEMEKLLREKLRMEGPASYWKKSAFKYRCQGLIWTLAVISWVALALGFFREFFLAWAGGDRMALNLSSLEGAVIFAAIISSFIFVSRIFSRLAFSSFHLQRDAEEREQLTHLYLALSHDLSVDDETRKIVLQSLFSRSETGLLANESGPTMPGVQDVVTSVMKRAG